MKKFGKQRKIREAQVSTELSSFNCHGKDASSLIFIQHINQIISARNERGYGLPSHRL